MDKVHRPDKPDKKDLLKVYDVCNELFKSDDCFYQEELKGKEKL